MLTEGDTRDTKDTMDAAGDFAHRRIRIPLRVSLQLRSMEGGGRGMGEVRGEAWRDGREKSYS